MRKTALILAVLACGPLFAQNRPGAAQPSSGSVNPVFDKYKQPDVSLDVYFTKSGSKAATPDKDGFILRWSLLEPISKPEIRSNTLFTDSWLRNEFAHEYFEGQMTILPDDGQTVEASVQRQAARAQGMGMGMGMGMPQGGQARPQGQPGQVRPQGQPGMGMPQGQAGMGMPQGQRPQQAQAQTAAQQTEKVQLKWHWLDSKRYNVKLYRFAKAQSLRPTEGLFLAVTVVNAPEDMTVRLAAGSNSASMWWVNGEEALLLSGDRRMVVDDGVSKLITLKKGKNIVRGAIINGPGMSDFCVRFIGQDGKPVTNLTITNK